MKIGIVVGVKAVVRMRMRICGDRRQRRQMVVRWHMYVVGKRLAVELVMMHVLLMPGVTAGQGTAIIGIGIVTMR